MQDLGPKIISYDISLGAEKRPIHVICRDDTYQLPKPFKYIRESSFHKSVLDLNQSPGKGIFCTKCVSACGVGGSYPCAFSAAELAPYTNDGLLHPHYIEMVSPPNSTDPVPASVTWVL